MPRRRPQSRVVTTQGREYVFSQQATIYDLKAHRQEQLRKELAALQPDSLLNHNVDEIVDDFIARYTLNVPVLDKAAIVEMPRQEIQIEVPRVTQNHALAGPGPFYVPGTLFTLKVPFTGDRSLLRYPASGFFGHVPAELGEDAVYLTYRAEKPDAAAIQREFDSQISRIETGLEFVRGPAQEWNNQLVSLIRPQVEKRHAQTRQNHSIDLGYAKAPAYVAPLVPAKSLSTKYDIFLSHASEDNEAIARPLFEALTAEGKTVWVRRSGSEDRRQSAQENRRWVGSMRLRHHYYQPELPKQGMATAGTRRLVALEVQSGKTKILPIWHEIDKETLLTRSPILADRVAGKSSEGIPALVRKILAAIR